MAEYNSYIDSQIPYVGMIPTHWKTVQNKRVMHKEKRICDSYEGQDIISLTMRGAIVRDLGAGGKMPTTFDGYQFVYPGELLMCLFDIDVTPRCVGRVYNEGLTSPAYSSFVLHDNADLGYFYYYYLMLDHTKELLHLAKNLRHSLTEEQLGQVKVPLPPIEEQAAIAAYLDRETDRVDAIIAEAKASIEEYKAWKASIIYEAVTKGLDPNVEMKDSGILGIGYIPSTWRVTNLKRVSTIRTGGTLPKEEKSPYYSTESGLPWIKAENLGYATPIHNTTEYYTEMALNEAKVFPANSVYVCCIGSIGKVGFSDIECSCNQQINAVTFSKDIFWKFGYYALMAQEEKHWYFANGNVLKILNATNQGSIEIAFPDYEIQKEIVSVLDEKCRVIDSIVDDKKHLIEDLESYKKSIIFEVVTGKRKVV